MSHVRRFDHVGITVADLDAVTAFFVGLGLEVENRMFVEGECPVTTMFAWPDCLTCGEESSLTIHGSQVACFACFRRCWALSLPVKIAQDGLCRLAWIAVAAATASG
jgi:catechol 2,3-dioxygenase-like lactoylglutathione lyase family enzyme